MSLIQMQEAIADTREDLERAGIRGIDLDYLLDPRVEHKACLANFEKMVDGPLARWREVMGEVTQEQLEFLKVVEPNHPKVLASKKASKELKNFFKGHVLCFFKDAERRANEARDAKRKTASSVGVELKPEEAQGEQQ